MLQRYFVIEKGIYCLWLLTFPYVVSSVSRICPSEIKEHIPQEKRSWGGGNVLFGSLAVHGAAAQMLVWGQCDGTIMSVFL